MYSYVGNNNIYVGVFGISTVNQNDQQQHCHGDIYLY